MSFQYTLILFAFTTALDLTACAAAPTQSEAKSPTECQGDCSSPAAKNLSNVKSTAHEMIEASCENKKGQFGTASFYGKEDGLVGKKTASGEILDDVKFTVAHRKLPFGTLIRITSITTKKSVVARVNDRGPYHKERILDLNYAAAKAIGLDVEQVGKVQLQICSEPK